MKNPRLTLGKIIRQFKARASKTIHDAGLLDFTWQRSFYDRIVRDEDELNRIREYILSNPTQWSMDKINLDRHDGWKDWEGGSSTQVATRRDLFFASSF